MDHGHITICVLHIMNHSDVVTINHFELLARIFTVICHAEIISWSLPDL
jgi:hypothetical protein